MTIQGNLGSLGQALAAFLKREDGANAAEFAMVVLPMAFITFAIIEVGSLMYVYNNMHNAAREAVREYAVNDNAVNLVGSYGCVTNAGQNLGSIEALACAWLLDWNIDYQVDAITDGLVAPYLTCHQVRVQVQIPMNEAAAFDLFGVLSGKTLFAEASLITEYVPGDLGSFCT